jgi:hypothetical protein
VSECNLLRGIFGPKGEEMMSGLVLVLIRAGIFRRWRYTQASAGSIEQEYTLNSTIRICTVCFQPSIMRANTSQSVLGRICSMRGDYKCAQKFRRKSKGKRPLGKVCELGFSG